MATGNLVTDAYQVSMMYAHFKAGNHQKMGSFNLFFRRLPENSAYVIAAGIYRAIEYLKGLQFDEEDLAYVESLGYPTDFIDYLRTFRFTGQAFAVREGEIVFPNEPLMTIISPIAEGHFVETRLLNIIGFHSAVATRASRCVWAAQGDRLFEGATRRCQDGDAATAVSWGSYIAGFDVVSNMEAGRKYGLPVAGTHAHAFVQFYGNDKEAFRTMFRAFPDNASALLDTHSVVEVGLPAAIEAAREEGVELKSVRLDSGRILHLSQYCRKALDEAGLTKTKIVVSGDMDENQIQQLKAQGAPVDTWLIGTALAQVKLDVVYKLAAVWDDELRVWKSRIKVSETAEKTTNPGLQRVIRFRDKETGKFLGDQIQPFEEEAPKDETYMFFDPARPWLEKPVRNYETESLLKLLLVDGRYETADSEMTAQEARNYCKERLGALWPDFRALVAPEAYHVNLSPSLYGQKQRLLLASKPH